MHKVIVALGLGLALAAPAASQTVDDIVAKNVAAKGGMDKIKAVQTVRMTGKMTLGPGIEAPVVLELKRPNMMRMDVTVQGMVGSQAYDGAAGWMLMPFAGSPVPQQMSAEDAAMAAEQADMDGPLIDYKAKGNKVELLGKEKVEGADAYKLRITLKNGTVRNIYIDAEHFLEIKDESKRMVRGSEVETETIVGDYKEVGGMMFPHSVDSGQKGNAQRQKLVVEKIELNVPLDPARFKMPEKK